MFVSAGHIGVKLDQDRSGHSRSENSSLLVICDGIGQYPGSGAVAELLVRILKEECPESLDELQRTFRTGKEALKLDNMEGGTTMLYAVHTPAGIDEELRIAHLGNGAVIHLAGDYMELGPAEYPYRYHHVILPHVDEQGALVRHFSHNSGTEELRATETRLTLNAPNGDIVLFVSDGIAALEEELSIRNQDGSYWRYQFSALQFVLHELGRFIRAHTDPSRFQADLDEFIPKVLDDLKSEKLLEDDAALGIVVTEPVLAYLKRKG